MPLATRGRRPGVLLSVLKRTGQPPLQRGGSGSEVAQSSPTLCDTMDCSPPGASVHGIFQARILGWVAIPFSRESSQPKDRTRVSCTAGRRFYHLSHQGSRRGIQPQTSVVGGGNCGPAQGHTGTRAGAPRTACALHGIHSGILIMGHEQSRSPTHGSRDTAGGPREVPKGTPRANRQIPTKLRCAEDHSTKVWGGGDSKEAGMGPQMTLGARAPGSSPALSLDTPGLRRP